MPPLSPDTGHDAAAARPPPGRPRGGRDPYEGAPIDELGEPVLPRWFVLVVLASVPLAVGALLWAFTTLGDGDVPVAERRPPSAGDRTHDVGEVAVGASEPVPYEQACPLLAGVRIAGSEADQAVLRRGLAGLCNTRLDTDVADRLERFAAAGGVVRFAVFERTGVDSTAELDADPPRVLVNAKFAQTDPLWIAPLVAYETTFLDADPATAAGVLAAREVEHSVCTRLLGQAARSRACADAAALLGLPDPLEALRAAGFR